MPRHYGLIGSQHLLLPFTTALRMYHLCAPFLQPTVEYSTVAQYLVAITEIVLLASQSQYFTIDSYYCTVYHPYFCLAFTLVLLLLVLLPSLARCRSNCAAAAMT